MTQLELKFQVENSEDLKNKDFVFIYVTITRANRKTEEEICYVHSNTYPLLKQETIHLMLTDTESESKIISLVKLDFQGKESTIRIQIKHFNSWRIPITIYAISDSYYQVVKKFNIVLESQQNPKEPTNEEIKGAEMSKYHEDNNNISITLFEQI